MNPLTLNRIEIIEELRKHTTKSVLDKLLNRSTASLRGYLTFKLSPASDHVKRPEIMKLPVREHCGASGRIHIHDFKLHGIEVHVVEELPAHLIAIKTRKHGRQHTHAFPLSIFDRHITHHEGKRSIFD